MQKRKASKSRKVQNKKREVISIKPRLLDKYNRQIHLTILLFLLLGPLVILGIEVIIDQFFVSPVVIGFIMMFGMFGMASFIEACIRGYKYAGIKRVLLFIKNLFVNPFLKKEKLKEDDLRRIQRIKEEKCQGAKWWLAVGSVLLIWLTLEKITGRENMEWFIILVVISMVYVIVTVYVYKSGKYHSLQHGTIVAKNQWFAWSGRRGTPYIWYTAEVKLDDGRLYEGVVYENFDYQAFRPGISRCIVYGISRTHVVILATTESFRCRPYGMKAD